jgi:hypothetical protein
MLPKEVNNYRLAIEFIEKQEMSFALPVAELHTCILNSNMDLHAKKAV